MPALAPDALAPDAPAWPPLGAPAPTPALPLCPAGSSFDVFEHAAANQSPKMQAPNAHEPFMPFIPGSG